MTKKYRVVHYNGSGEMLRSKDFKNVHKAMDFWDKLVDQALPGSVCQLQNLDRDSIMSEYINRKTY